MEGWADYRVKYFNSQFPVEFCSSQCDLLAAMQFWLERKPALAERLVIEQPLLIGTDFYVPTPERTLELHGRQRERDHPICGSVRATTPGSTAPSSNPSQSAKS